MKLTTALRSTIAQAIIDGMAAGTTSTPIIELYDGTIPASMGVAISDVLLAELAMTIGAATESGGEITLDAISNDPSANATGAAGWARILNRDAVEVIYLTVSGPAGGGDLELNTTSITSASPVAITSGVITVGGA
tara:strand:+ start:540 stop:947 length:408 start_codon:yes stop_codon:yes gene_type:complete